jgi:hypothetical protein
MIFIVRQSHPAEEYPSLGPWCDSSRCDFKKDGTKIGIEKGKCTRKLTANEVHAVAGKKYGQWLLFGFWESFVGVTPFVDTIVIEI